MFSDSVGLGSASWALIPATDFPKFVFVSHTEKKCGVVAVISTHLVNIIQLEV